MLDFIHRYVIKATIIHGMKENSEKEQAEMWFPL